MNLEEYRVKLGWTKAELARRANVREGTIRDAERGKSILKATAGKIAMALSQELGYEVTYKDIDGLKFSD
jgi:DNA-binding XRE family transcriptional regulator